MLGLWENLTDRQKMIGRPGLPGTSCTRTLPSRCSPARLPRCNLRLPTSKLTSPSSSFSSTPTCTTWLKCSLEGTCLPTIAWSASRSNSGTMTISKRSVVVFRPSRTVAVFPPSMCSYRRKVRVSSFTTFSVPSRSGNPAAELFFGTAPTTSIPCDRTNPILRNRLDHSIHIKQRETIVRAAKFPLFKA